MIAVKNRDDTYKYNISTRLLMQEALKKGYSINFFPSSSAQSGISRCTKDGRELLFKSTASALVPSYGVFAAEDKALTHSLLSMNDISVPDTIVLSWGNEVKEALEFLDKYKKLVVKPVDANHGDGISIGVTSVEALQRAVAFARNTKNMTDVIIQQQVEGREYRFLVVEGRVIAVAYRRPPFVTGDGVATVEKLIKRKNQDPRRGEGHQSELTSINIEDVTHHRGKQFMEYTPKLGEIVELLDTSNLSRGGESVDVTDIASHELRRLAEEAAYRCFLPVCGVDIITNDIQTVELDKSYIIELNITPGIRMHQFPSEGTPRDVAKAIFDAFEKTAHAIPASKDSQRKG